MPPAVYVGESRPPLGHRATIDGTSRVLPPGPRPSIPGSLVLAFWRDPTGQILRIAREHGDVASFRFGPEFEVLVNDPEGIQSVLVTDQRSFMKGQALQEAKRVLGDGLLTSEGEQHLRQRRLSSRSSTTGASARTARR